MESVADLSSSQTGVPQTFEPHQIKSPIQTIKLGTVFYQKANGRRRQSILDLKDPAQVQRWLR